jgi:hypothetical protein
MEWFVIGFGLTAGIFCGYVMIRLGIALGRAFAGWWYGLSGDRAGQWSIRVNRQWRICFIWREGGHAHEVGIVDDR